MKKRFYILLMVFISQNLNAQTLLPIENESGKWGFVNENNELIVNYVYDNIKEYFSELGHAFAFKDSVCYLIDIKGNVLIDGIDICYTKSSEINRSSNNENQKEKLLMYGILNKGGQTHYIVSNIEGVAVWDPDTRRATEEIQYFILVERMVIEKGLFGICYDGKVSNIEFENIKVPSVVFYRHNSYIHYHPLGNDTIGHIFAVDFLNRIGRKVSVITEGNFISGRVESHEKQIFNQTIKHLEEFNRFKKDQLIPLDLFDTENIRFVVKQKGKWGVIDDNFEFVLPCEYDDIIMHSEQIVANKDGGFMFFDYNGIELDRESYKTVKIGDQVWMAENLNFETSSGSWCYDDDPANCERYGRLYDWNTAKTVCPKGWRLPSKRDFEILLDNFGGEGEKAFNALKYGGSSKFNALDGGLRLQEGAHFYFLEEYGAWWSSSDVNSYYAWSLILYSHDQNVVMHRGYERDIGFYVRCIQN